MFGKMTKTITKLVLVVGTVVLLTGCWATATVHENPPPPAPAPAPPPPPPPVPPPPP